MRGAARAIFLLAREGRFDQGPGRGVENSAMSADFYEAEFIAVAQIDDVLTRDAKFLRRLACCQPVVVHGFNSTLNTKNATGLKVSCPRLCVIR